jgi:hypothetical protein
MQWYACSLRHCGWGPDASGKEKDMLLFYIQISQCMHIPTWGVTNFNMWLSPRLWTKYEQYVWHTQEYFLGLLQRKVMYLHFRHEHQQSLRWIYQQLWHRRVFLHSIFALIIPLFPLLSSSCRDFLRVSVQSLRCTYRPSVQRHILVCVTWQLRYFRNRQTRTDCVMSVRPHYPCCSGITFASK